MTKILPEYIFEVQWPLFVQSDHVNKLIEEQSNESNFRILKIDNYDPNIRTLTDFLAINEQVSQLLVASTHLFCLIVQPVCEEFDLTEFERVLVDVFEDSGKSFLLELCYSSDKVVRFIFANKSLECLSDERLFDLFEIQSCANESLIRCEFTISDNLYNEKWQCEPIAIRLMKTFDIKCDEDFHKKILKIFVLQSHLQALQAYLDLPMIEGEESPPQTLLTTEAINYKYEKNETLLFLAAEGDFDLLKCLLLLGADVHVENTDNETASDRANSANMNENLKLLLEKDARFPQRFHETYNRLVKNGTGVKKELRKICEKRKKFHAAITSNDRDEIDLFKKEFPYLKFAYTFTEEPPFSQAATTTALLSTVDEDYTSYFLLLDKGFCVNEADLFYMDITTANKNKFNALILSKLKREQPSHITFLLAVTKIYGVNEGDHEAYTTQMQRMHDIYLELERNSKLTNLLKLLPHSKTLIISVDFRNRNTNAIDFNGIHKGIYGMTYQELGRIYVSAGGKSNDEIAGVLMHELTHYALHIVFNNKCNPYYESDEQSRDDFDEIVKETGNQADKHDVVNNVFECYKKSFHPKELIVTIPHLIAMKVNELEVERQYANLFQFFSVNVMTIVDKLTSYPEEFLIKREVQQLNDFLGHSEAIENWNIWPENSYVSPNMCNGRDTQLVVCDTPRLFLADLFNTIVKPSLICSPKSINDHGHFKDCFIIASMEDFKCSSKTVYIKRIWHLTSTITLVLNYDQFDESPQRLGKLQKYFNNYHTSKNLVVFGRDEVNLKSIFGTKNETLSLEYGWNDLEQSSRTRLLATKIDFQGIPIELNKLIDESFSEIPMKKLVNGERIVIESSKLVVDKYDGDKFVDRSFTEYESLNEILSTKTDEKTSYLLSDKAGSGKSVMLSRITVKLKEKYPRFWVSRFNLHEHIDAFVDKTINDQLEVVLKHFLKTKISSQRMFERKLFQKLYEESKVILLLDAVDEVAPKFIVQVFAFIQNLSENIQFWITTRPHLRSALENVLPKTVTLELNPFSLPDHLNVATKFWKKELSLSDDDSNTAKLHISAERIFTQFIYPIYNTFNTPLITYIIADNYLKSVEEYIESGEVIFALPECTHIFDLFNEFVSRKLLIVSNEKGKFVAKEKCQNEIRSYDTVAVLEHFAMKLIYERNQSNDEYDNARFDGIDTHNIQRSGLVAFSSNGEPYFTHELFAEFFTANFLVKTLGNASFASYNQANDMFNMAMDILYMNIISPNLRHTTVVRFIDGGMNSLWNEDNDRRNFLQASKHFPIQKVEFRSLDYVLPSQAVLFDGLDNNAILLLKFFCDSLTPDKDRELQQQIFNESAILCQAQANYVRRLTDQWIRKTPRDIFESCILFKQRLLSSRPWLKDTIFNAFLIKLERSALHHVIMYFPRTDLDVAKDITFDGLIDSLPIKRVFDEFVEKSFVEKYDCSTLKLTVDIILDPKNNVSDDVRHSVIYNYEKTNVRPRPLRISMKHFDDYMEMKWMAMTELAFPIHDWKRLVNETVFENVIFRIFNDFNNVIVLKFYKWTKCKANDGVTYKGFVADTFLKYLWNCAEENGAKDIFDFVRKEIDLKEVLQLQRFDDERFNENSINSTRFSKSFPICRKYFTEEEFEILLFKQLGTIDEDNLISKILEWGDERVLQVFFQTLSLPNELASINSKWWFLILHNMLNNYRWTRRILNFIEKIGNVRAALRYISNEGTLFHIAAKRRDLSLLKLMWNLARPLLTDQELEDLLSIPDANNFVM